MPFPRVLTPAAILLFLLMGRALPAQTFSTLVTVTPCRVMDTRNPNGPLGGPFISGSSTRNVPIPSSSCQIPSGAVAYSLNVTVIPRGTLYFITVWPAGQPQPNASTLNSFQGYVLANAAIVPAGAGGAISVFASGDTDLIVDINGYYKNLQMPVVPPPVTIPPFPTVVSQSAKGFQSTAVGDGASSTGAQNAALGYHALAVNSTGNNNTAVGSGALASNESGNSSTAVGAAAMANSASGGNNTAVGLSALRDASGTDNTGLGVSVLEKNTGSRNTAIGSSALANSTAGISNIAVGYNAGSNLVLGNNNIYLGSLGKDGDQNTIRIGENFDIFFNSNKQTVYQTISFPGLPYNQSSGSAVYVDATTGKLSVAPSSRRYKEDIHDIGSVSDKLYQLRPVQFRYKKALDDGTKPIQFGLIAEEVANVYPELVIHNKDGQIEGVQYQQLPALLLNEIQKQQRTLASQSEQIRDLIARLAALDTPVVKTIATSAAHK